MVIGLLVLFIAVFGPEALDRLYSRRVAEKKAALRLKRNRQGLALAMLRTGRFESSLVYERLRAHITRDGQLRWEPGIAEGLELNAWSHSLAILKGVAQ